MDPTVLRLHMLAEVIAERDPVALDQRYIRAVARAIVLDDPNAARILDALDRWDWSTEQWEAEVARLDAEWQVR